MKIHLIEKMNNKKALSLCNGQGFNPFSRFPIREEVSSIFVSDVDYIVRHQATPPVRISQGQLCAAPLLFSGAFLFRPRRNVRPG